MFDRMLERIEGVMAPVADWASNNRYLRSIMTAILSTLTLTIVGAIAVIIGKPPIPQVVLESSGFIPSLLQGWAAWGEQNAWLRGINDISTGIIGIAFTLAFTFNLARHYKLNETGAVINSAMIYFLLVGQPQTIMVNDAPTLQVAMSAFGSSGIFSGIVITIITVELIRFFQTKKIGFRFPDSVPNYVQTSFNAILPGIAAVIVFVGLDKLLLGLTGAHLSQLITNLFGPLVHNFDNVYMVGFFMVLINLFWFLGIHGGSIVMPIILPIEIQNIVSNLNNYSAGLPYDKVFTTPVHFGFIAIGGAGVFALALLNTRSKSKGLRQVGKIGILPAIFNISEPTMFGTPIPLNTRLLIPFLLVPAVNTVITYAAFHWFDMLNAPILNVPAQTPVILIAMAASASVKAGLVALFIIVVDVVIYYPFYKRLESKMVAEEQEEERLAAAGEGTPSHN
ncbi:MAG: PTS transporter subunit EIIC [Paenibacillus macerans]|uniref:Permease IIC component n=1 Tax=Paenibacillus macerans TaxID=44252 RepID=A0A090ZB50_PAEMA|nr:PTS transporter subunit EIIC [Paenibacillus macerans]KFN08504.1 phosphotransferase system, EIIC family protein [Paenibacillus macerans]MBS5913874.1 PTS sugar transporter subunit IIC [Paenibacillus macerans]MCY7561633.1 PTS transporter subunit EIIC [Paenibacillus macerans]MDU5945910.1 PTS transporter subunit EIIC [Paenibacillus macerans]MDU7477166.1 PTS transporter subunit EIIC [Paenibacillus macerans]